MEISDQSRKLSWDFSHGTHGVGCKSWGSSPRRRRTGGGRRRLKWGVSDMASPVVECKLNGLVAGSAPVGGGGEGRIRVVRGGVVVGRSARKLAAGMWRNLAAVSNCSGGGGGGGGVTWHGQHDQLQFGLDSHLPNAKAEMEGATKWDHHCPNKSPIEVCQFHSHVRLLKTNQVATTSVACALQIELVRARNRVKELETERHLFKKKLKHFLRGVGREMASSMRRERKRMFLIVDELKGDLERERRNCEKMRNVNSKLMNDLADAKLSTEQIMQEFEKEKSAREFLEDVCHELGEDIQEHKANIRAVKIEFTRIQEEVEEERKMMQLAEVWREERVQMKLVDAKLILEEKYFQMNNLIADLESLLRSNDANSDVIKTTEARGQAMVSTSIQDINELCYPSPTNDMNIIFEKLQDNGTIDTDIAEFQSRLSDTHSSEFHNISPEAIESIKNLLHVHSDHSIDHDNSSRNARFRDTKTRMDGDCAGSADCTNGDGCIPSSSFSGKDGNENQESLNPKTNKISSGQKLKNKGPSLRKLWKSSPRAADILKTIPIDESLRLRNGSNSSFVAISPEILSEEVFNHNELVSQWCLPGQRNPHIARAMRGCIEWPRGIQRNNLKENFFEAGLESHKTQLRNVLKQRKTTQNFLF